MKIFSKFMVLFGLTMGSLSVQAQDVTADFITHVKSEFIGVQGTADRKWDNKFCAIPGLGGCSQYGGSVIHGTAKGSATDLVGQVGQGWYLSKTLNPWSGTEVIQHWIDLKLTFSYEGDSEGRKNCFPGDFYCGMEWGSLNPAGQVVVDLFADGNRVLIDLTYIVNQGNGDKPNAVMRDAMYSLAPTMQSIIQRFVVRNGSDAKVVIRNLK